MRAAKGLSQKDLAERIECSQSRISKFEASDDDDLRLGDLREYLHAINLDIRGIISPHNWSAVDQIKFHAFQIRDCLAKLSKLANDDEKIAQGLQVFHLETLYDLMKVVVDSSQQLPASLFIDAPNVVDSDDQNSERITGAAHVGQ